MTLAEIAAATGGTVHGPADLAVTGGVVTDSRVVATGDLFVCIVGERQDGHDHAAGAVAAGAAAVLAEREVPVPAVIVPDTVAALAKLARAVVDRLPDLCVIGVTGSSGKTSTKDLLAQVMELRGTVVAPPGSFNNEIGMPLTALRCDPTTRTLVAEMGARGLGHIAYLCQATPPTVGVVLNIGSAHLGEFGGREVIAQAKGELVEALGPDGLAVLNADDPLVAGMASRTVARVVTFGEAETADVRADDVRLDAAGRAAFTLHAAGTSAPVTLQVIGEHQVSNALAAAAVAIGLGLDVVAVAGALSRATALSPMRMAVTTRGDGVVIINDAYNANPESMRAGLKSLAVMARAAAHAVGATPESPEAPRSWAVLGEMKEIGATSPLEHDAIGRLAVRLNISRLIAVGDGAKAIHLGAEHEGSWSDESAWVPDIDGALALLRRDLRPGDYVLVKASRSVALDRVADALLADCPASDTAEVDA